MITWNDPTQDDFDQSLTHRRRNSEPRTFLDSTQKIGSTDPSGMETCALAG